MKTIWLNGNVVGPGGSGWNGTTPGPTITVTSGQTVRLLLNGKDLDHTWFIDVNNNFQNDTGEISSPVFNSRNSPLSFDFKPIIGQNIPAAGNWTYRCYYHSSLMYGTIRILQPPPSPDFSLKLQTTTLNIHGSASNSTTLAIVSISNFSGNVSLSSSSSPNGPIVAFTQNPVLVGPGSTNTSIIQVTAPRDLREGTYNLIVTGTGGTTFHSVSLGIQLLTSPSPPTAAITSPSARPGLPIYAIIVLGGLVVAISGTASYLLRTRFHRRKK